MKVTSIYESNPSSILQLKSIFLGDSINKF